MFPQLKILFKFKISVSLQPNKAAVETLEKWKVGFYHAFSVKKHTKAFMHLRQVMVKKL